MRERLQGPFWLDPNDPEAPFPPVQYALREPDGLLALGGDLTPPRLLHAYRQGIFPWYSEGQPILWWSPDPRSVIVPGQLHVSRSLRKTLRRAPYRITLDQTFDRVIQACSEPRQHADGTWITVPMQAAYGQLHELGYAHSVEAWQDDALVGGLYGLALGRAFFGESMFSRATDASKVAFAHLARQLEAWGFGLIDCQVQSSHLASLGASAIPRERFLGLLDRYCDLAPVPHPWHLEAGIVEALRA